MSDSYSAVLANKADKPLFVNPESGKEYRLSHLTQRKKAAFEGWLKEQAVGLLLTMRQVLPEADYASEARQFRDDVAGGKYLFFGEVAQNAIKTPDGGLQLVSILLDCPLDELMALIQEHGDRLQLHVEAVLAESAQAGTSEGNAPSGATAL